MAMTMKGILMDIYNLLLILAMLNKDYPVGQGVRLQDFSSIMGAFFKGEEVSLSGVTNYVVPSGKVITIVIQGNHAVILKNITEGVALYDDPQAGTVNYIDATYISKAFASKGTW